MAFLLTNGGEGAVNLALVNRVEARTDGTANFYFGTGSADYLTVDFGSTLADATSGLAKVTQALDPADLD